MYGGFALLDHSLLCLPRKPRPPADTRCADLKQQTHHFTRQFLISAIVLEVTSPPLKIAQENESKTLKCKSKTAQKRYTIDETH